MNQGIRVFMACFLGAFIGTVVALEVAAMLWWLGMIIGFVAGYLTYEFKQVVSAGIYAFKTVVSYRPNWQLLKSVITVTSKYLVACWLYSFTLTCIFTPIIGLIYYLSNYHPVTLMEIFTIDWLVPGIIFSVSFLIATPVLICTSPVDTNKDNKEVDTILRYWFNYLNPFSLLFYYLPKGLGVAFISLYVFLGTFTPINWRLVCRFCWLVYKEIHSDIRLLCGLDAAIGVVIGYFSGQALIGGLAGGLWGLINYEIVSKHLLKLVPKPSNN